MSTCSLRVNRGIGVSTDRVSLQRTPSLASASAGMIEDSKKGDNITPMELNKTAAKEGNCGGDSSQLLTGKIDLMKVQAEVEEGRLLFCKNKIEQLEKQNASLLKEQRKVADLPSQLMRADSTKVIVCNLSRGALLLTFKQSVVQRGRRDGRRVKGVETDERTTNSVSYEEKLVKYEEGETTK